MKKDIILAGVGGQGILSIAAIIGMAALKEGFNVKQAEVHGMSQRGGAVQSHLRISDKPVFSDLIPAGECDLILSVEPMESLRYLPWLNENGWLISNTVAFKNIPNYPDEDEIKKEIKKINHHILLDANQIAKEVGSIKASNMAILGAASIYMEIGRDSFHQSIRELFGKKGEDITQGNIDAFELGAKSAKAYTAL